MLGSKKIGKLFNVPIFVDLSGWLFISIISYFLGFEISIIYIISLLLHEFAHILCGKKYGITTGAVMMNGYGAFALMNLSKNPKEEFWISFAGPLSNIVVALIFLPLMHLNTTFYHLFIMNIAMGFLNLFPTFPMDGGRILRSILQKKFGFLQATEKVFRVGVILTIISFPFSIYFGFYILPFVLAFTVHMGYKELRQVRKEETT